VPGKKPKAWEVSYDRFTGGEAAASIATNQASGKPIQVATVVRHLLTALVHGRSVDLRRLHDQGRAALPVPCGAPSAATYDRLESALAACADEVDVFADKYSSHALAVAYGGPVAAVALVDWTERSDDQKMVYQRWNNDRGWWEALKRAGYDPSSSSDGRPAKLPRHN